MRSTVETGHLFIFFLKRAKYFIGHETKYQLQTWVFFQRGLYKSQSWPLRKASPSLARVSSYSPVTIVVIASCWRLLLLLLLVETGGRGGEGMKPSLSHPG